MTNKLNAFVIGLILTFNFNSYAEAESESVKDKHPHLVEVYHQLSLDHKELLDNVSGEKKMLLSEFKSGEKTREEVIKTFKEKIPWIKLALSTIKKKWQAAKKSEINEKLTHIYNAFYKTSKGIYSLESNKLEFIGKAGDMSSFDHVHKIVFKDKERVYVYDSSLGLREMNNIDVTKFQHVHGIFYKDTDTYYQLHYRRGSLIPLENIDFDTVSFPSDSPEIIKDKNGIYETDPFGDLIEKLNLDGYTQIYRDIFKKNSQIFLRNTRRTAMILMDKIDGSSFEKINDYYFKDNQNAYIYWAGQLNIINEADLETFEPIDNEFSRDQHKLFFVDSSVENIDPNNYQILKKGDFLKDQNRVFAKFTNTYYPIPSIDADSATAIHRDFIKDRNTVYARYQNNDLTSFDPIPNCDPENFKLSRENRRDFTCN